MIPDIDVLENDTKLVRFYTKKIAFSHNFDTKYYRQRKATYNKEEWKTEIEKTIHEIIAQSNKVIKNSYWNNSASVYLYRLGAVYADL